MKQVGIIQILDDQLSNMIAAGEVVERPASVVKELVENAIDAGSKRIEVHIEEGGLSLIKVVDDGGGMAPEDCEISFERHATSKIKRARDLFQISTLGFRGEALPSIAAVSRLELRSCTAIGEPGSKVVMEGGQKKSVESIAHSQGTEITVRDLFFNTPARLKYLKSIQTELGHISDYMNRLAFSYPEISFLLTSEGKTILKTYGDGQLLHVISSVYGMSIAKEMIPIQAENLDFQLQGYLGNPQITRANRSYISILVNGRYVKSHAMVGAILRGYHTLLPINRYPIAVLSIKMEPSLLDVNVHPAKLEVRISKESELLTFTEEQIRKVLGKQRLIPEPMRQTVAPAASTQTKINFGSSPRSQWAAPSPQPVKEYTSWLMNQAEPTDRIAEPIVMNASMGQSGSFSGPREINEEELIESEWSQSIQEEVVEESPSVPEFYPLAQLHGTYILAQSEEGLYMIDQHAAQERIWYEYFMAKLAEEEIEMQDLLVPLSIDLSIQEMKQVQEKIHLLQQVGLVMEPFGQQTFIIRSHPRWFVKGEEEAIVQEMIEMVIRGEKRIDTVKLREKAAITMSCKAAIKANRYLNHLEMEALLNKLRETTSPYTCPHGRPIIIHFSKYEIEKMFKRVM